MKDKLYFEEHGEQLLKRKGISKAEFARRLGIHKQNVNSVPLQHLQSYYVFIV